MTRITVSGPDFRVDLSVPGNTPVIELIRLAGGNSLDQPREWNLIHPVKGPLAPHDGLGSAGILDGEILYLHPSGDGSLAPFAEDVAEEAAAVADADPGAWTPDRTRHAATVLLGIWLGLFGPVLVMRYGAAVGNVVILAFAALTLAVTGGAALRSGRTAIASSLAFALTTIAASLGAVVAGLANLGASAQFCVGALLAAGVAIGAFRLGLRLAAVFLVTAVAAVGMAGWAGLSAVGLGPYRAAAIGALAVVVGIAFLPRLAAETTGLGRVADKVSAGGPTRRSEVRDLAARAREYLTWLLVGLAVPTVFELWMLALAPGVWGMICAVTLAAVLWLRARAYSHAGQVRVLVTAGAVGMFVAATTVIWQASNPLVSLVVAVGAAVLLAACATVRLSEITRIRVSKQVDRLELVLLIACGPLILGLFNAYGWAVELARQWSG
ncbi:type VII secretion integral membrane protein EccD [Herbidospora daliensis]|uniref:type VII secretion integral membrane protein EccD n=1 Tax=Herbidospora daliensis TaxID=295585 RepID=UPI0007817B6B|nr:type VII secretion integral membrane protein EccD [Herbidospora daliensis]